MPANQPVAVIVLAAGKGTRFKSEKPKVMHEICGQSMLHHALTQSCKTEPGYVVAVLKHQFDRVSDHVAELNLGILVVEQDDRKGTGAAVQSGLNAIPETVDGTVLVTCGDVPLLTSETIHEIVAAHESAGNAVTIGTAVWDDPTGYGRIIRDADGLVDRIVEQADGTPEELAVTETNSGIYAFALSDLREFLPKITDENKQREYYLTDVAKLCRQAQRPVGAFRIGNVEETLGVNDREQLADRQRLMNARTLKRHMNDGVTIVDPATTWIDQDVLIDPDVTILPGVQIHGKSLIKTGSVIGPDCTLNDVQIGENAVVQRVHATDSTLGDGVTVGPFAYLRPGTVLGDAAKIGTFVETKKADIGPGAKVPHLSYVGDATIGEGTNIGAASVFVNYDGINKHHTTIGKHCRTGSDNMFVAPVTVADGAYTAAGTVVRKDVPAGALALNVAPQRNLGGWVAQKRPGTVSAEAALKAEQEGSTK